MGVPRWAVIGCLVVTGAALLAMQLASRRQGSRIPAFGDVCGVLLRYRVGPVPVGRIGLYGVCWWLGWHFLAR